MAAADDATASGAPPSPSPSPPAPPQNLVFVDLETTGGSPAFHRIIEIGLVRFENGVEVEQWSALVDPEVPIPPYIAAFTGISNDMVRGAPSFAQIAGDVFDKLRGAVFVAHNARFDFSFLHREFLRLNVQFSAPVMCTVKLSRRLYPEFVRHNLDAVMQRHDITCQARHRALGDALVLRDLWHKLQARWAPPILGEAAANSMLASPQLPAHLPPELADELPDAPGVYRYYAADNELLYVGRSHSLRSRILSQLGDARAGSRDALLASEVRRVEWSQTAGELGAMLREVHLTRLLKPRYNRRAKAGGSVTLRPRADRSGRLDSLPIDELEARELAQCFGVFRGDKDARKALFDLSRAHDLCLKVMGFEESEGSCFAMQVGKCKGACVGKEPAPLHDMRMRMALSGLKIKNWPFAGRVALRERSRDVEEFHVVEHWAYVGSARSEEELAAFGSGDPACFDPDVYRILVRYLSTHDKLDWHDMRESLLN